MKRKNGLGKVNRRSSSTFWLTEKCAVDHLSISTYRDDNNGHRNSHVCKPHGQDHSREIGVVTVVVGGAGRSWRHRRRRGWDRRHTSIVDRGSRSFRRIVLQPGWCVYVHDSDIEWYDDEEVSKGRQPLDTGGTIEFR